MIHSMTVSFAVEGNFGRVGWFPRPPRRGDRPYSAICGLAGFPDAAKPPAALQPASLAALIAGYNRCGVDQ
jgi:hypothetical protein